MNHVFCAEARSTNYWAEDTYIWIYGNHADVIQAVQKSTYVRPWSLVGFVLLIWLVFCVVFLVGFVLLIWLVFCVVFLVGFVLLIWLVFCVVFLVGFVLHVKFRIYQVFSGVHVKFKFYQVFSGVRVACKV